MRLKVLIVLIFAMGFFTKPLAESTTVPHGNPSASVEALAQLEEVESNYQKAEAEFFAAGRAVLRFQREHPKCDAVTILNGKALVRVSALVDNPELGRLCYERELARQKRNELLLERARLLREAGRIS